MHRLPGSNRNEGTMDTIQQPPVHFLHCPPDQASRHITDAYERRNQRTAPCRVEDCLRLRAQREDDTRAGEYRAMGATGGTTETGLNHAQSGKN